MPADFETTLTVTCDFCGADNVYKGRDLAACAILAQRRGWVRLGKRGSVECKYACVKCHEMAEDKEFIVWLAESKH